MLRVPAVRIQCIVGYVLFLLQILFKPFAIIHHLYYPILFPRSHSLSIALLKGKKSCKAYGGDDIYNRRAKGQRERKSKAHNINLKIEMTCAG